MDSYDEVHDVKDGRDVTTPDLDLDVNSAIKFVNSERDDDDDEDDDKEDFTENVRNVSEEVNVEFTLSH